MGESGFDSHNLRQDKFSILKNIVKDFITQRKNDNLSIVVFGDFSFVALPLSFDKQMAQKYFKHLANWYGGETNGDIRCPLAKCPLFECAKSPKEDSDFIDRW